MIHRFVTGLTLVFGLVPHIAAAQNSVWVDRLLVEFFVLVPQLITALLSIAFIVFLFGLVRFIAQSGDEKAVTEGKKYMVWGIVALTVLFAVWGFVVLLQQMVGIDTNATATTPTVVNPL